MTTGSIMQTKAWAAFKERFGWASKKIRSLYGLERGLPGGRTILYFPEVPFSEELFEVVADQAKELVGRRIFTRFDVFELWNDQAAGRLLSAGLVKSFEEIQPEFRQWIMLDKSLDELLKEMKPKGRYNIRVAERHKLEVKWGVGSEQVSQFFDLYQHTASRADFQGRGRAYFQSLVEVLSKENMGEVITVSKDGQALSSAIIVYQDGIASYLYGGSGGDRSLMAPYLMHWEAIKRAKKRGCVVYDLLAIAPPESGEQHPYASLTRFKTQFGGQSVRMLGAWDLVHNRLWYTLYRFIEKRRRKIAH